MILRRILKTRIGSVLCLIMITVFFSSCAVLNELAGEVNIKRPQVDFSGAKITGLSFDTVELLFDLEIRNPNSVGLTMAGFNYDFLINSGSFLKGNQDKGVKIAAAGKSTVQLPLSLRYVDLYQTFQSLKNQDLSTYQMNFGFAFDVPVLGRVNIPVSKSGDFPLLKLPKISVKSVKLKGLALTGADLVLKVQLDNPNTFSMLLEKLQYQFAVDGRNWISGYAEEPAQVAEKGQGFVDIPIHLDLLQMGRSVYQLLSGNKDLNYSLGGNLDLATSLPILGKVNLPFDRSGSIKLTR